MKHALTALAVTTSLLGAALMDSPAQAQGGTGIPVIVMAEDSDPNSVKRSSDIFRRVTTELQDQLARHDFYVIDEDFLAAKLGWTFQDRRPKTQLVQIVDLAGKTGDATFSPRAMVIIKIRAAAQDTGFGTKAQVRINGDIWDVDSNSYLGGWEAPRQEFPAPAGCSGICITEVVGDHARDIATVLGDILQTKLAYLTRGSGGAATASPSTDPGLVNRYLVTFKNFSLREVMAFTQVMEREFPEFIQARAPDGSSTLFKYNYETRADANQMYRWMNVMLLDYGYPESQFKVLLDDRRKILVDKLYEGQPAGLDDVPRFN